LTTSRCAQVALYIALTALAACSKPTQDVAPEANASVEAGVTEQTQQSSEQARLQRFFEQSYAEDMQRYPFTASYRGIKDQHDQWNSYAEAFQDETRAINEARLEFLNAIDADQLDADSQLSLSLYRRDLERRIMLDDFRDQDYVIHQFWGPHTTVPSSLINIHQVTDVADAEAYIGRIRNVSVFFDEVIEQLNIRTEAGLTLVDWMYPQILDAAKNVITGAPFEAAGEDTEDSAIWADFQEKVASLDIEPAQRTQLLDAAKKALIEQLQPAYQRLIAAIEAQSDIAASDDGIWRFENGDVYYQTLLNWFTTTELTADEIHALGLANVARLQEEMRGVMAEVGFEGDLQAFFAEMRENQDLRYPNTDEGREQYLADARAAIDAMSAKLPDYFGLLPKAPLKVKRVEPFRERSAGKAFYQSPPPDGSRPGIYYANLYDMSAMPRTDLEALAFHEGVPGHHLQLSISAELDEVPDFQRYLRFTAFSEGWGLYSEYLAKEMGFYQDPYSEFGRLAMELWRAARLVVDTGLHSKRWTREEAIDYLLQNTPNAEWDCVKAIERYIAMPGQATAYMIGKIRILELRDRAQQQLGDAFDIREFHDTVLASGPVPLDVLAANVERMIANKQGTAI